MTRDEQVDVVAQAIRNSFLRRQENFKARPWSDIPRTLRKQFMDEAKAAIEAYESTLSPHDQRLRASAPL